MPGRTRAATSAMAWRVLLRAASMPSTEKAGPTRSLARDGGFVMAGSFGGGGRGGMPGRTWQSCRPGGQWGGASVDGIAPAWCGGRPTGHAGVVSGRDAAFSGQAGARGHAAALAVG
ncbi:hypothetical protein G6F54_014178 [Rhizopus delemar]|nr:hypothetical protein G6F54_014178 [Rhizopus delemar]